MYDCYLLLAISLPNINIWVPTAVSFLLPTVCQAISHVQVLHNASRMGWFGSRVITSTLGGYEFGLEIESVLGKFEKTIYNDI